MGIQFLEESHTPEILRAAGPGGLHVDELARKIDAVRGDKGAVTKPLDSSPLSTKLLIASNAWLMTDV